MKLPPLPYSGTRKETGKEGGELHFPPQKSPLRPLFPSAVTAWLCVSRIALTLLSRKTVLGGKTRGGHTRLTPFPHV